MSERLQTCQCNKPTTNPSFSNHNKLLDKNRKPLVSHPPLIQTKLTINQPGDEYEQEADRVAEQMMRMPDPASVKQNPVNSQPEGLAIQSVTRYPEKEIQRKEDDNEEEGIIQMKQGSLPYAAGRQSGVPPIVHEVLSSPGVQLDPATRTYMEPRFGHDFSKVRIHSGLAAEQSAREVNAHAYTVGHNIVFGTGQFAPSTYEGRRLIAHELTHVVQQSLSNVNGVSQSEDTPGRSPITSISTVGITLQRETKKITPKQPTREKKEERFPWIGRIHGTYSAALRSKPHKDPDDPHAGTVADLAEGTFVEVFERKGGWLRVRTSAGSREVEGYVSQELVEFNRFETSPTATGQTPQSGGPAIKDILRLDQTVPIKGLAKDQPNYIDHFSGKLFSAPLGPDITLIPKTGPASQNGVSIPKGEFYIDADPLSGFSFGQNQVYKSRAVAEAVVTELMKQTPDTPVYTYYLQDGIIFPTTLSDTTVPNLMPHIRQRRQQDLEDIRATADLAKAVMWWYIGARFPIKIRSGGAPAGTAGKEAAEEVGKGATAAKAAFDASKVADELFAATQSIVNPGQKMITAARQLSNMFGMTAAQKSQVMLEFFKRIGFAISKAGVVDDGARLIMYSEDSRYAFAFVKDTSKIMYGKFNTTTLDYVWELLK